MSKIKFIKCGLVKYPISLIDMEMAHENVLLGIGECIFITEHEALYSAGKSFNDNDFLKKNNIPIYYTKRGGRVTIHSPGQIVVYPIINLKKRDIDIRSYVNLLEEWIILVLKDFDLSASRCKDGIGIWISDSKIGFIGIRIEKGISTHGLCLNISNDLSLFKYIIPCGITGLTVTSLENLLNYKVQMNIVADLFIKNSPF